MSILCVRSLSFTSSLSHSFSTLFKLSTSRTPTKIFDSFFLFIVVFTLLFLVRSRSFVLFLSFAPALSLFLSLRLCLVGLFFSTAHAKVCKPTDTNSGGPTIFWPQNKVAHAPAPTSTLRRCFSQRRSRRRRQRHRRLTGKQRSRQSRQSRQRSRIFVVGPLRSQYANVTVCRGVSMRWAPPRVRVPSAPLSLSLPSPSLNLSRIGSCWALGLDRRLASLLNVCL